jgi:hypothetical protein
VNDFAGSFRHPTSESRENLSRILRRPASKLLPAFQIGCGRHLFLVSCELAHPLSALLFHLEPRRALWRYCATCTRVRGRLRGYQETKTQATTRGRRRSLLISSPAVIGMFAVAVGQDSGPRVSALDPVPDFLRQRICCISTARQRTSPSFDCRRTVCPREQRCGQARPSPGGRVPLPADPGVFLPACAR